jgi:NTP pyrophosphatase (non-canonical NTP hydrolase)
MVVFPKPTAFSEYQGLASLTDRGSGSKKPSFAALGFFGESGSVLTEVKKKQRDALTFRSYHDIVLEEIGDALWYLTTICTRAAIDLDNVAIDAAAMFNSDFTSDRVQFDDFERIGLTIRDEPSETFQRALRKLGAQAATLLDPKIDAMPRDDLTHELAVALNLLAEVAYDAGIRLKDAAASNIEKTLSRWPTPEYRKFEDQFDEGYPDYEQLPRLLEIEIFEVKRSDGRQFVMQRINNLNIGDRLTDNIMEPDDYRFHDVFHYAYAANLHWSPVLRSILKTKRKSDLEVDESQDGARATLIEEGIATFVFNFAKPHFFANTAAGDVSYDLLKAIRAFVAGFEVESCPPWLWEKAILEGFEAFRFLQARRRGRVVIDLDRRSLEISPLP